MIEKVFIYDNQLTNPVYYSNFFSSLEKLNFNPICRVSNYIEVFKNIVFSILIDREITLLDYDFPDHEIKDLDIKNDEINSSSFNILDQVPSLNLFIKSINTLNRWSITLYTSGTTGKPKKVVHKIDSLIRFVKSGKSRSDDIWGFTYNPTHIAGLQVFFQALLNMNSIVYIYNRNKKEIQASFDKYRVTNISATPTFYRLLQPFSQEYSNVKYVTSGGERLDNNLSNFLNMIFPNAKLTNVYASTEVGSLFASKGEYFKIPDKFQKYIKIENKELLVHKKITAQTLPNNEKWFRTGDIVEFKKDSNILFKIIARNNELINVGGYNVNLSEIEELLRLNNSVLDCIVYSKPHRLVGNIICSDVVLKDDNVKEIELKKYLSQKIQKYKIPAIINIVDSLKINRANKLIRS
jgi:acyl-coenzyme A synthetase/AMP-(fatty) acid ligase